jgi:hypothetical protein
MDDVNSRGDGDSRDRATIGMTATAGTKETTGTLGATARTKATAETLGASAK